MNISISGNVGKFCRYSQRSAGVVTEILFRRDCHTAFSYAEVEQFINIGLIFTFVPSVTVISSGIHF